jgi:Protein of unknown function (DUF1295)
VGFTSSSVAGWQDATRPAGALTIVGPLLMTFLLTRGSGQALTERRMADRPQYADYIARTSGSSRDRPEGRPPNPKDQIVCRSRRPAGNGLR